MTLGNGWLGVGWDLSVPSITVDTRWGVPRYDNEKESEVYILQGEQLVTRSKEGKNDPMPHRTNQWAPRKVGNIQYHPRKDEAFDSIIRHGDSPSDYWWSVTDRNGITHFYGKHKINNEVEPTSVLRDDNKNIAHWALTESRDPNGNTVRYEYEIVNSSGVSGGSPGKQIYLKRIKYTGFEDDPGLFCIVFNRKDEKREDVAINGRYGFKEVSDELLCTVEVYYRPVNEHPEGNQIPEITYIFCMENGLHSNYKTRLTDIVKLDSREKYSYCIPINDTLLSDESFNGTRTHFDYYNRPSSDALFKKIEHTLESSELGSHFLTGKFNDPSGEGRATALGATKGKSWSLGGTASVGLGANVCMTTLSVGGNFDYSQSSSEGLLTLIDLDGDGLVDKVYKKGDQIYYCKHMRSDDLTFKFGPPIPVKGINTFLSESSKTTTWGLQASAGVSLSGGWPATTSTTTVYFSDVNADGLPDLITEKGVLFNTLENGIPHFYSFSTLAGGPEDAPQPDMITTSALGPCGYTIFDGEMNDSLVCEIDLTLCDSLTLDGLDAERLNRLLEPYSDASLYDYAVSPDQLMLYIYCKTLRCEPIQLDPDMDAVKVWIAPKSGVLKIESIFQLLEDESESRRQSKYVNGVRYTIQLNRDNQFIGRLISGSAEELFSQVVEKDNYEAQLWDGKIEINKDDILFFRLQSNGDRSFDKVMWEQILTYEDYNNGQFIDEYGEDINSYIASKDFIVTGEEFFQAPEAGTVRISGPVERIGPLYRNARLEIRYNEEILQEIELSNNFTYEEISIELDVKQYDSIKFRIFEENLRNTTWSNIKFIPQIAYTGVFHGSCGEDVKETFYHYPPVYLHITNEIIYELPNKGSVWDFVKEVNLRYYTGRLFGSLYRGWGQFAYNNEGRRATDLIDIQHLKIDPSLSPQISMEDPNDAGERNEIRNRIKTDPHTGDETREGLTASFDVNQLYYPLSSNTRWVEMRPNNQFQAWVGYGNINYITREMMTNTRIPELVTVEETSDIITYDHPVPAVGPEQPVVKTVRKQNRSKLKNYSYSAGMPVVPISVGESTSKGNNTILSDYMDLNGDLYPDALGEVNVQYTMPWGGIGKMSQLSSNVQKVGESSTSSSGETYGASYPMPKRGTGNNPKGSKISFDGQGNVGSSLGSGTDNAKYSWLDINGDGLPDKVSYEKGGAALNLGYKFLDFELWRQEEVRKGKSDSEGLSIGGTGSFNTAQASISGGLGINHSENITTTMLMDFNGDGLPDKVSKNGSKIYVSYNLGNGLWSPSEVFDLPHISYGKSYSESANAGITAGFTFLGFLKFNIGVQSAPYNRTFSKEQAQWMDINGDGYPDYVVSFQEDKMTVYYNRTGKTNLLKEVTNFTGSSMEIDYEMPLATYEQPQRSWVMNSVKTNDPCTPAGGAVTLTTYSYENPNYDRFERMDYGFDKVTTRQFDTENNGVLYRYTTEVFHNQYFLKRGKKKSETVYNANGKIYEETLYDVYLADLNSGEPVGNEDCPAEAYPLLESIIINYYWGDPKIQLSTGKSFKYDRKRNVIQYINRGDLADQDDDLISDITYKSSAGHNMISLAEQIEVKDNNGTLLRKRHAEYDRKGNIIKIDQYNLTRYHQISSTELDYDIYGNITKITYPHNINFERHFYEYTYDTEAHAYPVQVSSALLYTSTAEYNYFWGKPEKTKDINGNKVHYEYDRLGRLTNVKGPLEIQNNIPYTIRMEYEPANYGRRNIYKHRNYLSRSRTFHYDEHQGLSNPIVTYMLVDGWGRNVQTKKDSSIDGQDMLTVSGNIKYDAFGRIVLEYYPFPEPLSGTIMEYNPNYSQLIETSTVYDILDRPVSVRFPDASEIQTHYGFGNDNAGKKRFQTITKDGNGIETTVYTDPKGLKTSVHAPDNIITVFEYNALGELLRSIDPERIETHYEYDMLGNCISRTHPDSGTDTYEYDDAGNLIKRQTQVLRENGDRVIRYHYSYNQLFRVEYPDNHANDVWYVYGLPGEINNTAGRIKSQRDGTSLQVFSYNAQGQIIETVRTFVLPHDQTYTTGMKYRYDSWNRIQEMEYPDGERIYYKYDNGGNLLAILNYDGDVYLENIIYDEFGRKTFMKYGNGSSTTYKYDNMQRLEYLYSQNGIGEAMQEMEYQYDPVGNIKHLVNHANKQNSSGLGGQYDYYHEYDENYRLIYSGGDFADGRTYRLNTKYSSNGRITNKTQNADIQEVNNYHSIDNSYDYKYNSTNNRIEYIENRGVTRHFEWDANGNMILYDNQEWGLGARRLSWDEENRVKATADPFSAVTYGYDGQGERTWKVSQERRWMNINGVSSSYLDVARTTLYASPYLVANNKGYTKHYYAGSERLASRIGTGGLGLLNQPLHVGAYVESMINLRKDIKDLKPIVPDAPITYPLYEFSKVNYKVDFGSLEMTEWQDEINEQVDYTLKTIDCAFEFHGLAELYHFIEEGGEDKQIYYYHTDHLGSSSWITDYKGISMQHMQYLPFGETWTDQRISGWNSRYTFSGKEKDKETGLSYFGARYYDADISIWLSVDPLANKYPSLSPYVYCANNPIQLIDPDGRKIVIAGSEAEATTQQLENTTSKKFNLIRNSDNTISYEGKARTKNDRFLKKTIDNKNITVNIIAEKAKKNNGKNTFTANDGIDYLYGNGNTGGAYGGNEINADGHVNTYQYVAPEVLDAQDNLVDGSSSGGYMLHEVAESFFGGKIALKSGVPSPRDGLSGSTYDRAHKKANRISGGELIYKTEKTTMRNYQGQALINPITKQPLMKVKNYWSRD